MNYSECIENARTRIGNYCKACPECNGRACKNQMPGPGAKGIGDTAIRNYDKWKEIRVQMDTIVENKPVDTSLELFGKKFLYPFFAGPVGAVGLHYGDCLDDVRYNDILVSACAKYGIAAFTGDGLDSGCCDKSNRENRRNRNPDCETMEHRYRCRKDEDGSGIKGICSGNGCRCSRTSIS